MFKNIKCQVNSEMDKFIRKQTIINIFDETINEYSLNLIKLSAKLSFREN